MCTYLLQCAHGIHALNVGTAVHGTGQNKKITQTNLYVFGERYENLYILKLHFQNRRQFNFQFYGLFNVFLRHYITVQFIHTHTRTVRQCTTPK